MVQEPTTTTLPHKPAQRGQALIEYALILVLVVMALVAAVAATGPALGNVFSNTVFNLVGITGTPQDLWSCFDQVGSQLERFFEPPGWLFPRGWKRG